MVGDVLVREETSGAGNLDPGYRALDILVESGDREQLGGRYVPVPLQVDIVVVRRFQVGITLAVEAHADVTEGRYFLRLRQCVRLAGCQT